MDWLSTTFWTQLGMTAASDECKTVVLVNSAILFFGILTAVIIVEAFQTAVVERSIVDARVRKLAKFVLAVGAVVGTVMLAREFALQPVPCAMGRLGWLLGQ
jgi:hypothetical protein